MGLANMLEGRKVPFQTKQEWLYNELREAIENCDIQPGERLMMDKLADTFGVSRVPVREALLQLQAEGLVQLTPHVGAVVAPITQASAQDYFAISRELQVLAVRAAAFRMSADEKKELEKIVCEMESTAQTGDLLAYSIANNQFHSYITEHCHMPLVPQLIANFHRHWHRFERYYNLYPMSHVRMEITIPEHRNIMQAILDSDADRAEAFSREHNITGLNEHLKRMKALEGRKPAESPEKEV